MSVIAITKQSFRDKVIEDIQGNYHPELRLEGNIQIWFTELVDLKISAEVQISLLDDAEFYQGSMNHHNALGKSRDAKLNTQKFLHYINEKLGECRKLNKETLQKKAGSASHNKLIRTEMYLNEANKKLFGISNNLHNMIEQNSKTRERQRAKGRRVHAQLAFSNHLLQKVICMWEDGVMDYEIINEIKDYMDWDIPNHTVPNNLENNGIGLYHNYEQLNQDFFEFL